MTVVDHPACHSLDSLSILCAAVVWRNEGSGGATELYCGSVAAACSQRTNRFVVQK